MGWWQRLLSVRSDGETTFQSFDVVVRDSGALLLTVLTLAVAVAVVVMIYRREPGRVPRGRRLVMCGVRILAIALLCLLIFRPFSVTAVFTGERPRSVALLVDNSKSMARKDSRESLEDKLRAAIATGLAPLETDITSKEALSAIKDRAPEHPSRMELTRSVLTHTDLQLLDSLAKLGPLRSHIFGDQLQHLATREDKQSTRSTLLEALTAREPRTALADVLGQALLKGDVDLPAAMVVMTDGCDNDSRTSLLKIAEEYRRLGVPLHIYGAGSTEGGTLQLVEMSLPSIILPEDQVAVPIRWKSQGINKGTVKISLLLEGEEVASKEVPAREGEDLKETLTFTPGKVAGRAELLHLTARIELKDNPRMSDSEEQPVRLLDRKVKVLYVEDIPRWEYKYLQRALRRDRRVEARFLLLQGDEEALKGGDPYLPSFPASRKDLFDFDLLILGDVKASDIGSEQLKWIAEFVSEGGGLILISGRRNAPASFHGTVVEEILPIEYQPLRFTRNDETRPTSFQPRLSRFGRQSEMLSLAESQADSEKAWEELPGMYWFYPVGKLKPGAIALLEHPEQKAGKDAMPLMAWRHYGKGQALFIGFEETWRWRFNAQDQYHARFWGQVAYQLGLREAAGSKRAHLTLDRPRIYVGREGRIFAHILDSNYQPLKTKTLTGQLEQKAAPGEEKRVETVQLSAIPGLEGEYQAFLPHDREGRFTLKIPGEEEATLEYRVERPPENELAMQGLAASELERAATLSGGAFYREEDLHRLPQAITRKTVPYKVTPTVPLLNPLTFLIFLGLLTTEWILRKMASLS